SISPDPPSSHQRFRAKYNLPFYLLCDTDHSVAKAYGAWGEKKNFGRTYQGIIRSTFVLDEEGRITKVFPKVRPAEHAQEVLQYL
ncbi:MAG: redoxin domain-containing protein, partial [Anaerolineae bacterium]|nr:redoxin domain-containing protein [Anaerolineae bacterium]